MKNEEIKVGTTTRQIELLTIHNRKLQVTQNDALAQVENLDRELSTQKEVTK